MKFRIILLTFAAAAVAACAQSPEERIKAYEEAHDALMKEYREMMDSLSGDQQKAEAYYNEFVEKYIEFNLNAAKKNSDNDVALQVLMNTRGLLDDAQVEGIITKMSPEMLENEKVAALKTALDARKATAEGKMFVDFTVNTVIGHTRSIPAQPIYSEVKLSDYVGKGKYILLDFWSPWCGPCRMVAPVIDKLAEERLDVKFGKVNVDEEPQLAAKFGVVSIPTLVVMDGGAIVAQAVGARPKEMILEMLNFD